MNGADGSPLTIAYRADRDGRFTLESGQNARVIDWADDHIELLVDGVRRHHRITEGPGRLHVQTATTTVTLDIIPRFILPGSEVPSGGLTAPMPGSVVEIRCAVGDVVASGQVLVVLEAMKMEHHVHAPFAGTVTELPIAVGQQLDRGTPLATLVETDAAIDGEDGATTAGLEGGP